MRIFVGVDNRQPVAYSVLRMSLEFRASKPVTVQPIRLEWSPMKRAGLTAFTFTRYMVPYICDYKGKALFLDADMLCLGDINELAEICDSQDAGVCVVKNPRRFEWPSLMYFDNEKCQRLTPELIETGTPQDLRWSDRVGDIPAEWNHLSGYDTANVPPKLIHYTMGLPVWEETKNSPFADEWHRVHQWMNSSVSFQDLMGRSVHVQHMAGIR